MNKLQPWTLGPLYHAKGNAEVPFPLLITVLSSKALTYSVVLELDFIFFSGTDNTFSKSNSEE